MNECCKRKLELAQARIEQMMDEHQSDEYLKGLQNSIAEIDEVIFRAIAKFGYENE